MVGFKELGLVNSFTLEASFCGAAVGRWAGQHFSTWHLEQVGREAGEYITIGTPNISLLPTSSTPPPLIPPCFTFTQMGAGVVTALLDYWDPEGYGMADLMAELDFMHPVGAEGPRKFITVSDRTGAGEERRGGKNEVFDHKSRRCSFMLALLCPFPSPITEQTDDGQLVEVDEDDEPATDSDDSDEEKDEEARVERKKAIEQRKALRAQAAQAAMEAVGPNGSWQQVQQAMAAAGWPRAHPNAPAGTANAQMGSNLYAQHGGPQYGVAAAGGIGAGAPSYSTAGPPGGYASGTSGGGYVPEGPSAAAAPAPEWMRQQGGTNPSPGGGGYPPAAGGATGGAASLWASMQAEVRCKEVTKKVSSEPREGCLIKILLIKKSLIKSQPRSLRPQQRRLQLPQK